ATEQNAGRRGIPDLAGRHCARIGHDRERSEPSLLAIASALPGIAARRDRSYRRGSRRYGRRVAPFDRRFARMNATTNPHEWTRRFRPESLRGFGVRRLDAAFRRRDFFSKALASFSVFSE